MKRHRLFLGLAFVLGSLGLTSCYEKPDFELTPNLTFRGIEQRTMRNATNTTYDSLIIVVRFQDGDGNLGLSETLYPEDIQPPFNPGGEYFYNMICNIYKKVNGNYERVLVNGNPINYNGRFPRVSTEGRDEPLEGDIRYSINIFQSTFSPLQAGDTIRFDVKVMDRTLHESQTVTTSDVILFSKPQ
ncbi:hypothetical protein [Rufibacter hautae]|uniref:Uncharacterized protein n=1 Tax=Rufibacter hautae TaxID=2595005 RepID=A0A5B6TFH1_9BACT|nr:hypothetical protein [Rufibacter hautae]KAA3437972.1 hypothetical protein FOA19_11875 [Rufibacter hautae]